MVFSRKTKEKLKTLRQPPFVEEKLLERKGLQRLLKADISVLGGGSTGLPW